MADDDSEFTDDDSVPNEEDAKMKELLAEWDEKDMAKNDVYVDSDEDDESGDDGSAEAKKAALLKSTADSDDDESEEAEEEVAADSDNESEAESAGSDAVAKEAVADSDAEDSDDDQKQQVEADSDEEQVEADSDDEEVKADSDEEEVAADSDEEEEAEEDEDDTEKDDDEEEEEEDDDEEVEAEYEEADEDNKSVDTTSVISVDSEDEGPIVDQLKKKPKKKKSKKPSKKVTDIDEDDEEEDIAMKELLASWDADNGADDDEEEDDDDSDDDDSEESEREVVLEDNVIDHIVLASSDLDEAMKEFENKTGLGAVIAGTIKGLGIKCARVSFADSSYLEIIAPDPKGPGPIGELIKSKGIKELTPFHYAIRTRRTEALKDEVSNFGYTPDHITMFGAKSDGTPRKWEMLYLYGHKLGGICPFFINWANSDHPCATLPVVGKLKKLTIRAPDDDPVHELFEHVGVENIKVDFGKPKITFSFQSPEGTVKFSSHKAVGFKFPGFEADVGVIPGDDGSQDADVVFQDPVAPDLLPVSDDDYEPLPEPAF